MSARFISQGDLNRYLLPFLFCLFTFENSASAQESSTQRSWSEVGDDGVRAQEASLCASLEKTIQQMPGVSKVRVHIALKDTRLLARIPQNESRAAVVLWQKDSRDAIPPETVEKLILATVPALSPQNLSILTVSESEVIEDSSSVTRSWMDREARTVIMVLLILCVLLGSGWIRMGLLRRKSRRPPPCEQR